jgi:hypothetical protein
MRRQWIVLTTVATFATSGVLAACGGSGLTFPTSSSTADSQVFDRGYQDGYNEGYQDGYDDGYAAGASSNVRATARQDDGGYHDGYDQGYKDGYDDGYRDGYEAAIGIQVTVPDDTDDTVWTDATQATLWADETESSVWTDDTEATTDGDDAVRIGVQAIARGCSDFAGAYGYGPAVDDVSADGAVAAFVKPWPTNPYTGAPMAQSNQAGDFTFDTAISMGQGQPYMGYVTGVLSDGSTFPVEFEY